MPAKFKPTADPTVLSLINDKIDTLETNITGQITTLKDDLGGRITELSTTVKVQNGRLGRVETSHAQCQLERQREARTRRRVLAAVFGVGGTVGALATEVVTQWLQR